MVATLTSPRLIFVLLFVLSAVYTHFRGKVRFKFLRQLTDHSTFMAPINAFMYLFSAIPTTPYLSKEYFPELQHLEDNWEVIRDEAVELVKLGYIKASDKYDDVGYNSFFRTGWKRFFIKWYADFFPSAEQYCPKTVELMKGIPLINAASFALLSKGGKLVRHRDPYAGSIRYHLGLITPNSDKCYINVDEQVYSWRDGKPVLFDETYIHFAENDTDLDRIILFIDVARPMKYRWAQAVNSFFSRYLMRGAASRNFDEEPVGWMNKVFKYIYAVRLVGKRLKAYNRRLYYCVKYLLFGSIIALFFLM